VWKAASWKQKSNTRVGNVYTWTTAAPSKHWVGGVPPAGRSNPKASDREKFEKLRAKYLDIQNQMEQIRRDAHAKYGPSELTYASKAMKNKDAALRARQSKVSDEMYAILALVSPRDWRSGVPLHWVLGQLTWEDAVRPTSEKLSVTPPLAYGQTHAKENPVKPTKALEAGVKAWQLYIGSSATTRMSDQQKLYRNAMKAAERLATKYGISVEDAARQLSEEAQRRGKITPVPGQHMNPKRRNTALAKAPKTRAVKHAANWYKKSHWSIPATKAIHVDDPDLPAALTVMGTLTSITVRDKGEEIELDFTRYSPKCHLAFDPRKSRKLYNILSSAAEADVARRLITKDGTWYRLNDAQREFTDGRQKRYPFKKNLEVQLLGKIRRVLYFTNKKEDAASKGQGGVATYDHAVGEETHRYPLLGVDRSGRLWWVGGAYTVIAGGIKD
jgi:hypothetical protein